MPIDQIAKKFALFHKKAIDPLLNLGCQKIALNPAISPIWMAEFLGRHDGIHNYTIGQRKGLNISYPTPLYVHHIDDATNTVVVGEKDALDNIITLHTFSSVSGDPIPPQTVDIKLRYLMKPIKAKVTQSTEYSAQLYLQSSHAFITPGQSCVLYKGDRILGGGIIEPQAISLTRH